MYYNDGMHNMLNQLPISAQAKMMYSQLYGQNQYYQKPQYPVYQQYQHNPLQYSYQTNFIPGIQYSQSQLPMVQVKNIDPLPMNYNIGQFVQNPGDNQIRLGFDLSQFGLPSEPPKPIKIKMRKSPPKQQFYQEVPHDYLETVELPRIQRNESLLQQRVIQQNIRYMYDKEEKIRQMKSEQFDLPWSEQYQKQQPIQRQQQLQRIEHKQPKVQQSQEEQMSSEQTISKSSISQKQQKSRRQEKKINKADDKKTIPTKPIKKRVVIDWNGKTKRFRINMLFLNWYLQTLYYLTSEKRKEQLKLLSENAEIVFRNIDDWIDSKVEKFQLDVCNTRDDLNLQLGQDKINEKKKAVISKLLDTLFTSLNNKPDMNLTFVDVVAKVFNIYCQNYNFPPKKYFLKFEALRLNFNSLGGLQDIKLEQQRVVIIGYFLIRRILIQCILNLWNSYPDQQNTEMLLLIQRNSIILGSIIHEVLVKYMEKTAPINKKLTIGKLKTLVEFKELPLSDNEEALKKSGKKFSDNVLVDGILPSALLMKYIYKSGQEKEPYVEKIEQEVIKFTDQIIQQLNKEHEKETKEIVRVKMFKLMLSFNVTKQKALKNLENQDDDDN
ncbi:hypothetical protein pb186bvf_020165 [Paramecium bursaria]